MLDSTGLKRTKVGTRFEHAVQLYSTDSHLSEQISRFVAAAFDKREPAVVVATDQHRSELDRLLSGTYDLQRLRAEALYITYDARAILEQFMVDGQPSRTLFRDTFEPLFRVLQIQGQRLNVFGETVALLWQDDNHTGALRLEAYWEDLAREFNFRLFCAYPVADELAATNAVDYAELLHCHNRLINYSQN